MPQRVRIIGGDWRRTPLPVLDLPGLRPTPDRVRQTVFDWIAHLKPDLSESSGLDLYAGTGALGLELASRGARRVVLIERQPAVAARLRELRDRLDPGRIDVLVGDAVALAQRLAPASFDVIFVDPPYGDGQLAPALAVATRLLALGGLIYAEAPVAVDPAALAALRLAVLRQGRAGQVHFNLLHCGPS
jgi:16S rRNA (guanine(966)-N(2))-methyltransferase RsmD